MGHKKLLEQYLIIKYFPKEAEKMYIKKEFWEEYWRSTHFKERIVPKIIKFY